MASIVGFVQRMWTVVNPPQPAKSENAIRIGLLGASNIGPIAIINPARSHPEVIIAAVAARDETKAKKYAEKYGIPTTFSSYQDLIDDPSIDAVYVSLPNGLHYEWAIKCLAAGKHILLEKPSVSNSTQAHSLFTHPLLSPNPKTGKTPILLEAFHSLFHPAFQSFLSLLDRPNIAHVTTINSGPKFLFPKDDIRFLYDLAGGALMDCGTYNCMILRNCFGEEPVECVEAGFRRMPKGFDPVCEEAVTARWKWENGGFGEIDADLRRSVRWGGWFGWVPWITLPIVRVRHREVVVPSEKEGKEHVVVRTVEMWNFLMPFLWHSIKIVEEHTVREVGSKKVVKRWTVKETKKAYNWMGEGKKGEVWWTTYRCQLEEFVNMVRGREGSGVWMDGNNSIKQMEMIDSAYKKAGVPVRPGAVE